ncbi:MAG TPA: hypothetical protein PLU16_15375 [Gallionellaceae bacterium]|jgi:hypothetical protein|nr:hypothetical protein [Gallionellaceae bacterium]HQS76584.1 hypothetical protein [Gallionellaceae bacterium]
MKKIIVAIVVYSAITPTSCLAAESLCPFPRGLQITTQATKEAVNFKNAGIPKSELLSKLPKGQEDWVYKLLNEIVDEVYSYPTLKPEVYGAYRFEHCFISSKYPSEISKVVFSQAHPRLIKCEEILVEKERTLCAINVVHDVSGIPD